MDFSSILRPTISPTEMDGHKATILKKVLNNGAYKIYADITGHVQRTEISLPEGKVIIIKDYEKVPAFAHYRSLTVLSSQDISLGSLSIVPEDRKLPNSSLRFYDGNTQIGSGSGDIGLAIADKLLGIEADPRRTAMSSVDPDIITSITNFLKGK
jgi:hypothetical protein